MTSNKIIDFASALDGQKRVIDHLKDEAKENLKSGGGGGTFDDMEHRVTLLEKRFDRLEPKLDGLIKDVSEIKGKISNMPSTWQMIGVFGGLVALLLAGSGTLFALIRHFAS